MQGWQTPYLGLRDLPRELTEFELQAFFSFSRTELELIARRRGAVRGLRRSAITRRSSASAIGTSTEPASRGTWRPSGRA